jgi:hypothetical protein
LKNNGRFSSGGIFINVRNDSALKISTKDISQYILDSSGSYIGSGVVRFNTLSNEFNPLDPNEEVQLVFNLSSSGLGTIYAVDLNPIRWQEEDGRSTMVNCGDARISEELKNCFSG